MQACKGMRNSEVSGIVWTGEKKWIAYVLVLEGDVCKSEDRFIQAQMIY